MSFYITWNSVIMNRVIINKKRKGAEWILANMDSPSDYLLYTLPVFRMADSLGIKDRHIVKDFSCMMCLSFIFDFVGAGISHQ